MNDNNSKEFLSIGEFAEVVGMSTDKLRYYDRSEIFRPAKHGDGESNKYRYYSP
ncbi:MAG: MerR family transcriptional regulator, partial [Oscillospiraceae bacterium]|nr:MerR family transcriptional regulator [Oscillospiraceae bacterium]